MKFADTDTGYKRQPQLSIIDMNSLVSDYCLPITWLLLLLLPPSANFGSLAFGHAH